MNVYTSDHWEQFICALLQSERDESADAVIDEGMRLLEKRDEQAKRVELRHEIAIGIEQADRGELSPFDPQATLCVSAGVWRICGPVEHSRWMRLSPAFAASWTKHQ